MRLALLSLLAPLAISAGSARAAETVKIGGVFSLTGNAAAYGAQQKAGVQLAVDEVNKGGKLPGVTLELVLDDDGTSRDQGITVFQRLINREKVSAIIGPTLSTTATAADPIAQASKVPVVAVSNTAPKGITDIGDYVWRVSLTEAQVIPAALALARQKLGFKTAALLYGNDDAFTKAGFDVMEAALKASGVQILGIQTFATRDRDFNAQLTALKDLKPDILLVSALVEQAGSIAVAARQLGYTGPIMGGNGFNSTKFIQLAGPAAEGVLVGTAWNRASQDPVNQAFIAAMKARGTDPDQFAAQAYTGVLVIADAIRQAGLKGGRDDIKAGFAKVKDLPTPLGKFSFLPNRDGNHPAAVQVVRGGKFEILQ
ncbi:MAG TPA: ABC transporter substrate-binding protein [Anaeromyxobacteraceae bacterium]|nr:ABC transporter substrate-binding protein [Anaeromyxobacteraceae bacterium]